MPQYNDTDVGAIRPSVPHSCIRIESIDNEVAVPKQVEQILDVLEQTVYKLEMILCMPLLLDSNAKLLSAFVTREELEIVRKFTTYECEPINFYEEDLDLLASIDDKVIAERNTIRERILRFRDSIYNTSDMTIDSFFDDDVREHGDSSVTKAINLLFRKPMLLNFVKNNLLMRVSSAAKIFLHYIYHLQNQLRLKILTTPKGKDAREKNLRRAWNDREPARIQIAYLGKALSYKMAESERILSLKKAVLERDRDSLLGNQMRHKGDIQNIVNKSECAMAINWRYSDYNRQTMQENLDIMKWNLNEICCANLLSEKQMRNKKSKVESQLVMIIAKYDNDMKELQASVESATEEMELDRAQLQELQSRFDEQEVIYMPMATERDEEERRLFDERMYRFLMRRSGRRILKYYRAYKARKLARKRKAKLAAQPQKSETSFSQAPEISKLNFEQESAVVLR